MDKQRAAHVWKDIILPAYDETVEYTRFGATGDPKKTIKAALEKGTTPDEIRSVLAVIAKIKEDDGRFSASNRRWLYEALPEGPADWYAWYTGWGVAMGDLDHIHTAHLDGLVSAMRRLPEEG